MTPDPYGNGFGMPLPCYPLVADSLLDALESEGIWPEWTAGSRATGHRLEQMLQEHAEARRVSRELERVR